jgi:hypothetical protein
MCTGKRSNSYYIDRAGRMNRGQQICRFFRFLEQKGRHLTLPLFRTYGNIPALSFDLDLRRENTDIRAFRLGIPVFLERRMRAPFLQQFAPIAQVTPQGTNGSWYYIASIRTARNGHPQSTKHVDSKSCHSQLA